MRTLRSATVSPTRSRIARAAAIALGSLVMALGAHVAIPVPFSPVPITGQTFALALVVAFLGTRGATLAVALYVAEGFTGLRVFSPVGILGPTLGYIVAFPVAAFVTGWLFDRGMFANYALRAVAIFAGTAVVFAGGASYLAALFGWPVAIATGVVPFVAGDIVKTLLAAAVTPLVRGTTDVAA